MNAKVSITHIRSNQIIYKFRILVQSLCFCVLPLAYTNYTLGDKKKEVRQKAVMIIKTVLASEAYVKHIENESGVRRLKKVRQYIKPMINFSCRSYHELVRTKYQVHT